MTSTVTFTPTQAGTFYLAIPAEQRARMARPRTARRSTRRPTRSREGFSLDGPDEGLLGQPSAPYTVALPAGTTLDTPVTIMPSDGGQGGSFSPHSVQLSTAQPSATFTYSPASQA